MVDPIGLTLQFQKDPDGGLVERDGTRLIGGICRTVLLIPEHRSKPEVFQDQRKCLDIGDPQFEFRAHLVLSRNRRPFVGENGPSGDFAQPK